MFIFYKYCIYLYTECLIRCKNLTNARERIGHDKLNGKVLYYFTIFTIIIKILISVAAPSIHTTALKIFIFFAGERGRRNHLCPHKELNYFYLRKPNLLLRTAQARFELQLAGQSNIFTDQNERVCSV